MTPEEKKAYMAAWYQKNKARLGPERREYLAAYYQANKEKAAAVGKAYREKNREAVLERERAYRQSARGRETQRAWREANSEKVKASKRAERQRNKDTRRDYDFRQKYGITLADYDRMFAEQDGLCAICFQPPTGGRRMAVDHNHETGKVRGLLCLRCNLAIGNLRDDPMVIASAFSYVEAHNA